MIISKRFIDFFRPGDVVPDGTYDADTLDKLLAKGQFVEAGEDGAVPVVPLEDMTDQELKDLAKAREIKGYWSMKRQTLIETLKAD